MRREMVHQAPAARWTARSAALRWSLAALVLLTAICVIVSFSPSMPGASLDPSWRLGMNQAVAQGLTIGRDIVFTFGPYASMYTGMYHPATDARMVWSSLLFAVCLGLAVVLAFRRGHGGLQLGVVAMLHLMFVHDPELFFYPVLVAVQAVRGVCREDEPARGPGRRELALLLFLLLPFGLLPLVKGSAWVLCALVTAVIAALFAVRRQWKRSALVLLTPLLALVAFWLAAGQPIGALLSYFRSMLPIVSGYTEAMAIPGSKRQVIAYAVVAALLLSVPLASRRGGGAGKTALVTVFAAALFLAFKAGFVRHDGHAVIASTLLVLMGLLVAALYPVRRAALALVLCALVWWSVDTAYLKTSPAGFVARAAGAYRSAWTGLRLRIADPQALPQEFERALARLRGEAAFPKLAGSTDLYSYDQSYLIASGNEWNPRPVFQSYSAYTPALLEANKAHLLGPGAPDNLIYKVAPIDDRLPPLEDGASWPAILRDYEPVSFANDFLFLHRRASRSGPLQPPGPARQYALGQQVPVPAGDAPVFVSMDLRPTALGALAGLLYKPTQLRITVTLDTGATRSYRLVSGMAHTGFVISPLVENTPELALLYGGSAALAHKRVRSFSIAPVGGTRLWDSHYDVAFTTIPLASPSDVMRLLHLPKPAAVASGRALERAEHCDGVIDALNGASPVPDSFSAAQVLNVNGWLAVSAAKGVAAQAVHLVASGTDGRTYLVPTRKVARPDVGAHFGQPQLDGSGYVATADVSGLHGQFTLGLAYEANGTIKLCPQFAIPGRIGGP